ncbi:MAG: hypothetical protein AAF092_17305 [Pseudomonadota bacterium]
MIKNFQIPGKAALRRVSMASGAAAAVIGVGLFMQNQHADAARADVTAQVAPAAAAPAPVVAPETAPAATLAAEVEFDEPLTPTNVTRVIATPAVSAAAGSDCMPNMSASVTGAALVELSVSAPCAASESFIIHHEGMMFSAQTDHAGSAFLIVPAMSEAAFFIAAFENGAGAVTDVTVPEIAEFDRIVLQWRGNGAFEMHAKEFGAEYGEEGHVWYEAPRTAARALRGDGGFLMALGDGRVSDARFAQVYSYPRSRTAQSGAIALSVEAEVTASNCETDVQAQTLERAAGQDIRIMDLTLQVPGCDAIGDFMVLSHVLPELTL